MEVNPLPFRSRLEEYQKEANRLLEAFRAGDHQAVQIVRTKHPRFLDERIPWLPKRLPDSEIRGTPLDTADAQLTLARCYDFQGWPALREYVQTVVRDDSSICRFETAVEAVINGNLKRLELALRAHPELVRARSTRVTCFDPPVHGATLLHYLGANGVEGYRQKTPQNAVEIATLLLEAGAEVDALAGMYGGQHTTLSMLVSSDPPAKAGLQLRLIETLLDFGAAIEGRGSGEWTSPVTTALVFGFKDAAELLAKRGAKVASLPAAAGLGRQSEVSRLLPTASSADRHRALALSAQLGYADIVRLLLDAGEDPNRYNPKSTHSHATPLHQAVSAGHGAVVRLLVERGARLGIRDTIYQGTPLGWAEYLGQTEIAEYLRAQGGQT